MSPHGALTLGLMRAFRVTAMMLVLSACTIEQPTTASFEQISLSRTQCYGRCPVYSVLVRADGSVAYTGSMHVKAVGTRTATVSAEDLDLLKSAIRVARLQELRPTYVHMEDGCTALRTDLPSIIITARMGGTESSVNYYLGCKAPEEIFGRIKQLADTIDKVAGTHQWVGK